jgi:hypothetical protein
MDLTVAEFLEKIIIGRPLEWVEYATSKHTNRSTLDRENALLIKFSFVHPAKFGQKRDAPLVSTRGWGEAFDIERHAHWYSLRVEDPLFRWGKRSILEVEGLPGSETYAALRRAYESLAPVRVLPSERWAEAQIAFVGRALKDILK